MDVDSLVSEDHQEISEIESVRYKHLRDLYEHVEKGKKRVLNTLGIDYEVERFEEGLKRIINHVGDNIKLITASLERGFYYYPMVLMLDKRLDRSCQIFYLLLQKPLADSKEDTLFIDFDSSSLGLSDESIGLAINSLAERGLIDSFGWEGNTLKYRFNRLDNVYSEEELKNAEIL